jgi:hypothetical protein
MQECTFDEGMKYEGGKLEGWAVEIYLGFGSMCIPRALEPQTTLHSVV